VAEVEYTSYGKEMDFRGGGILLEGELMKVDKHTKDKFDQMVGDQVYVSPSKAGEHAASGLVNKVEPLTKS